MREGYKREKSVRIVTRGDAVIAVITAIAVYEEYSAQAGGDAFFFPRARLDRTCSFPRTVWSRWVNTITLFYWAIHAQGTGTLLRRFSERC